MNLDTYTDLTTEVFEYLANEASVHDIFVVKYKDDGLSYVDFVGVNTHVWKPEQLAFAVEGQRSRTEWAETEYNLIKRVRKVGQFGNSHVYLSSDSMIISTRSDNWEYTLDEAKQMSEAILKAVS